MQHAVRDICPQCHEEPLRAWDELTEDERMLVERLPGSAQAGLEERRRQHRWCKRCWYEDNGRRIENA
jgi:hypothetical protein